MMLLTVLYGTLAFGAVWATWRDADLFWIGFWLVLGFVVSNLLFHTIPITDRPGPYTFIEVMVAVATVCAWAGLRYRWLVGIVALNLLSIGFNTVFAASFPPTYHQQYLWVVATNLCFAGECLITIGVGIAHGYRTGRFHRRLSLRRAPAQPNAARDVEP